MWNVFCIVDDIFGLSIVAASKYMEKGSLAQLYIFIAVKMLDLALYMWIPMIYVFPLRIKVSDDSDDEDGGVRMRQKTPAVENLIHPEYIWDGVILKELLMAGRRHYWMGEDVENRAIDYRLWFYVYLSTSNSPTLSSILENVRWDRKFGNVSSSATGF